LTNEESKGVRLGLSAEGLCLTSRSPERGEAEVRMDMELCDLQKIVEEAVDGQLSNAELKKQNLTLEIDAELPHVRGNVLRLGQAISNLVSNAVKYTPDKGNIQVSVASEGGQVVVTVEDDGIGIPQDDLPYIFDKFYRVESPETEGIVGSGLGLSMVKTIAEKHQGRIWAESDLGLGSTFSVVLPVGAREQIVVEEPDLRAAVT